MAVLKWTTFTAFDRFNGSSSKPISVPRAIFVTRCAPSVTDARHRLLSVAFSARPAFKWRLLSGSNRWSSHLKVFPSFASGRRPDGRRIMRVPRGWWTVFFALWKKKEEKKTQSVG